MHDRNSGSDGAAGSQVRDADREAPVMVRYAR